MPNVVFVVGLGPGDPRFLTAQAQSALTQAEVLCGYTVYLDLVRPYFPDKLYYSTGMTKEIDRCRWALETARSGRAVALVCSGDAGVYGMASPLLELAEHFPDVTVEVVPGLTAALSGGAVLGAALYAFSGWGLYNIFFNHFIDVLALFPWMLWALDETIYERRHGFDIVLAIVAVGVILLPHDGTVFDGIGHALVEGHTHDGLGRIRGGFGQGIHGRIRDDDGFRCRGICGRSPHRSNGRSIRLHRGGGQGYLRRGECPKN